jgi:hypothetical protein
VGGKKPWGWECLYETVVSCFSRNLNEWHYLVRMTREKRVVCKVILGTFGYCEGEGLQPCGAALWVRSKDGVFGARFEAILDVQYALGKGWMEPVVVEKHHPL